MRPLRKNIAGQFFFFQAIKVADGLPFTDTVAGTVAKDGGNAAAIGGTVALVTGSSGMYRCAPSQADTNADFLGFNFTGSGMIAVVANMPTTALNPQDAVRGGQTALPNADANTQNGLGVLDVNGHLPGNVLAWGSTPGAVKVGGSSGLPDVNLMAWQDRAIGGAANMIETGTGSDRWTAEALIQGPIADVSGLSTFNPATDTVANVTLVDTTTTVTNTVTADLVNDAIKATTIEASALDGKGDWNIGKTGYSLSAAGNTAVASAVAALEADAGITWNHSMQIVNASQGSKTNGGGTAQFNIRNPADSKNRIQATVDSSGNRSAVTLNLD